MLRTMSHFLVPRNDHAWPVTLTSLDCPILECREVRVQDSGFGTDWGVPSTCSGGRPLPTHLQSGFAGSDNDVEQVQSR